MKITNKYLLISLFTLLSFISTNLAAVVINDDLVIQGSQCVGSDCINAEVFNGDTIRLKENNLRIRMQDSSITDMLGQSWSITANDSTNGGESYFSLEVRSLTQDTLRLSDGTAPSYDCSVPVPLSSLVNGLPPSTGVIPAGEPVINPRGVNIDLSGPEPAQIFTCDTVSDFTTKPVLKMGAAGEQNNVTLGFESQPEAEAVSIGNTGLVRQLKHVAAGIAATDVLITQTLNNYKPFQDQENKIAPLQQQLTDLDTQISSIEDRINNNQAPTNPELLSPGNSAILASTTVDLSWLPSTDADDDELRYSVTICENQDFTGCTPEVVTLSNNSIMTTGLGIGSGAGMLVLFGLMVPQGRNRKHRWMYVTCVLVAALVSACSNSGGGGDNKSENAINHAVTGLSAGAQYYWKVSVTDYIDHSDSMVRSFTTQ